MFQFVDNSDAQAAAVQPVQADLGAASNNKQNRLRELEDFLFANARQLAVRDGEKLKNFFKQAHPAERSLFLHRAEGTWTQDEAFRLRTLQEVIQSCADTVPQDPWLTVCAFVLGAKEDLRRTEGDTLFDKLDALAEGNEQARAAYRALIEAAKELRMTEGPRCLAAFIENERLVRKHMSRIGLMLHWVYEGEQEARIHQIACKCADPMGISDEALQQEVMEEFIELCTHGVFDNLNMTLESLVVYGRPGVPENSQRTREEIEDALKKVRVRISHANEPHAYEELYKELIPTRSLTLLCHAFLALTEFSNGVPAVMRHGYGHAREHFGPTFTAAHLWPFGPISALPSLDLGAIAAMRGRDWGSFEEYNDRVDNLVGSMAQQP